MITSGQKIAVLILAAGNSSRMGQAKQLLPWKGTSLLNHAIGLAKKVTNDVFVALGARKEAISSSLKPKPKIIINENWEKGMGSTIAVGVSELKKKYAYDAILIMLSDQPLLGENHLEKLISTFVSSKKKIVATSYENKNGVPAIFHSALYDELIRLDADYGARKLMQKHSKDTVGVIPTGNPTDIDTLETYYKLITQKNK